MLLRAKALHSSGWVARLRCEERGRLAAASVRRLRGVRQQVHIECERKRAMWAMEKEREREVKVAECECELVRCLPASIRTSAWVSAASVYGPPRKKTVNKD
jgi:hypothetical protein